MTWQEIRKLYPHRWLVVEAIDSYTEGDQRVVNALDIAEVFAEDWRPAWERYVQLHEADPRREYYVLHTDREALNIGVLNVFRASPVLA